MARCAGGRREGHVSRQFAADGGCRMHERCGARAPVQVQAAWGVTSSSLAPNWLGDAVMALPLCRRPAPRVAGDPHRRGGARRSVAPLFAMVPAVGDVDPLDGSDRDAMLVDCGGATRDRLEEGEFDAALLLPNSFLAAWVTSRARIPERWGFARDLRGRLSDARDHAADAAPCIRPSTTRRWRRRLGSRPATASGDASYRSPKRCDERQELAARSWLSAEAHLLSSSRRAPPMAAPSSGCRSASPSWPARSPRSASGYGARRHHRRCRRLCERSASPQAAA